MKKSRHNLEYEYLEKHGTPVVFINSLGSDYSIWDDVVPTLSCSSLRYNQRGHGGSSLPESQSTISALAHDLRQLALELELEKIVVVGISVGGQVALEVSHRHMDFVEAVVLCDTGLQIGTPEMWQNRINAVRQDGLLGISDSIMERWFTPAFRQTQPQVVANAKAMLTRTPAAGYIAMCQVLRDSDLRFAAHNLGQQAIPKLVIHGAEDQSTPLAYAHAIADMAQAQLEVIAGSGHLPCLDNPSAFSAVLNRFLEKA
jgi:3-oxoadipate enol-lactonase